MSHLDLALAAAAGRDLQLRFGLRLPLRGHSSTSGGGSSTSGKLEALTTLARKLISNLENSFLIRLVFQKTGSIQKYCSSVMETGSNHTRLSNFNNRDPAALQRSTCPVTLVVSGTKVV